MATLHAIAPASDRAKAVRRDLGSSVRDVIRDQGDDLAGYVLVAWDMRGQATTSLCRDTGPIGRHMLPGYVHEALCRAITASSYAVASVPRGGA